MVKTTRRNVVPDADLPVLKEAFLDGLQAARKGIPNPHVDFDRGCAFALGQHWTDPPNEQRVYLRASETCRDQARLGARVGFGKGRG
jgi:hypothetical protein